MIASELAQLGRGQPSESNASNEALVPAQNEAADQMQVSRSSVQRARIIAETAPDLAAKVKSGEMKVSKAASIARERTKAVEPSTDKRRAVEMVLGCEKWAGRSDRWIADQVGVSHHTVEKLRTSTGQNAQLARTGKDGN